MKFNINFSSKFKIANFLSILIFTVSILFIVFKGLNYGIDFKGGTLIELRVESKNINISDIRSSLKILNLGDINVKQFGKKGDYLIKIEQKADNNNELIPEINEGITKVVWKSKEKIKKIKKTFPNIKLLIES